MTEQPGPHLCSWPSSAGVCAQSPLPSSQAALPQDSSHKAQGLHQRRREHRTPISAPVSTAVSTAVALTQLPELREHVHNKQAVIGLIFHHRVQPEVHISEFRQGAEPQHFGHRGDAVVVEIEPLQRGQVLNALSTGQNAVSSHFHKHGDGPSTRTRTASQTHLQWPHAAARKSPKREVFQAGGSMSHTHETAVQVRNVLTAPRTACIYRLLTTSLSLHTTRRSGAGTVPSAQTRDSRAG